MKMLRLRAYYEPEITAASHLDKDLEKAYIDSGIDCIYYTPIPTRGVSEEIRKKYINKKFEEKFNGKILIHRFSMISEGNTKFQRMFRYLACNVIEYFKGIKEKNIDIIYSSSTPPTQGFISALVAKKLSNKYQHKVPFVYDLQDVFPDSLVNAGMTKKGSLIWKVGRKIENYTYRNADKIIVISEGFKRNLLSKGVSEDKIEVISNWIDLESVHPVYRKDNKLIKEFNLNPNKFIVVYAGNFGAVQGADIVLKVARELQHIEEIQFVVFGGGAYFGAAKEEARELKNVFIHELLPLNRISEVYSLGDIALITCKKGTGNAGMPSKTWSIMACNTPIIASFDVDSDLADVIRDSAAGKCIEPESVEQLVNAVLDMYKKGKKETDDLRKYVELHASKDLCVKKHLNIIQGVIDTI